jgi:Domain of unknown function (DUF4275)
VERAFHNDWKRTCYVFFQDFDDAFWLEDAAMLTSKDLMMKKVNMDIYVVDKEFIWTFVITYEKDWCGPYFSR